MARGTKTTRTNKKHSPFDPRVDMFKQFYLRPDSYTFMNIRQSALRAGYSENYSDRLSTENGPIWFQELIASSDYNRAQMLKNAEKSLYDRIIQESETDTDKRLQHDASKFVAERLGRDVYSTRQEITGADGRRLFDDETRKETVAPLNTLFKGIKATDSK